jgi:competence protein ComEC
MAAAALLPAIALIIGVSSGIAWQPDARVFVWMLPLLVAAAAAAWRLSNHRVAMAVLVAGFGCCGCALGSHAAAQAVNASLRSVVDLDAREPTLAQLLLTEDASTDGVLTTLRGDIRAVRTTGTWQLVTGGVIVSIGGRAAAMRADEWRRGSLIEAPIIFRRPARYLNDGVADFERDAALDGISLFGSVKSTLLVRVVRPGTFADERAADLRAFVRRAVARHVGPHSPVSAAIVSAVLIGDRSGVPDEIRTRLQAAGTYHVIAISGGNIAILATILLVSLMPIGLSGRRAAFATLVVLIVYAGVVTAGPSVWRATLVAVVYLTARLLDQRTAPWQAMAVAGAVLAVCAPLDVRNAGFVLTFGATGALLYVVRRIHHTPRFAWLAGSLASSAAVEIVLLPVMAGTFSRVTMAGLALNLVAVPAMAVVQIAGLVAVCFSALDSIGSIAGLLAHLGAAAIVESARLVELAPWLSFRVPAPSPWMTVTYYVGLAGALLIRRGMLRGAALFALLLSGLLIVSGYRFADDVAGLRLTMVDVGQGDAMVLQAPGRHALAVDTGGRPFGSSFDIGGRVLEPALWARGIASLDALLVTHGDPDHVGGALPVIDDFRPAAVWQGIPVPRAAPLQEVLARAVASGANVEQRRTGEAHRLGNAQIVVVHPEVPDWERQRVRNDDSVVLEVIYGDVALLLTGDIGADVERQIVPRLVPAKTRILKVAHHGSRTSTSQALLDAWRPDIALISCGRGNPFGHPAPEVIARLERAGARIYRTDLDGEITLDTDGHEISVRTFVGGRRE